MPQANRELPMAQLLGLNLGAPQAAVTPHQDGGRLLFHLGTLAYLTQSGGLWVLWRARPGVQPHERFDEEQRTVGLTPGGRQAARWHRRWTGTLDSLRLITRGLDRHIRG